MLLDAWFDKDWLFPPIFAAAAQLGQARDENKGAVIAGQLTSGFHLLPERLCSVVDPKLGVHVPLIDPLRCIFYCTVESSEHGRLLHVTLETAYNELHKWEYRESKTAKVTKDLPKILAVPYTFGLSKWAWLMNAQDRVEAAEVCDWRIQRITRHRGSIDWTAIIWVLEKIVSERI